MRLVKALDAILTIIAFGRKQLCDLVDAARRAKTTGPRTVKHAFPNPELMIAQVILRLEDYDVEPATEMGSRKVTIWPLN